MQFNYNDLVISKENTQQNFKFKSIGIICFINSIDNEFSPNPFSLPIDSYYYSVELKNGSLIEIPGEYLEKYKK
jgi:hypothetical protein